MPERRGRIRRCPSGPGGARSPRSTSWRSWPPMMPPRTARRGPCCAVRACTPATSWRGGGLVTPAGLVAWAAPGGRNPRDKRDEQIAALQAERQRLEQELAKARFVVEVQAKLHALLETLSESGDTEPRSTP